MIRFCITLFRRHSVFVLTDRTTIVKSPFSRTANVSMTVTFVCVADTDRRERSTIILSWFKDGQPVSRNRDFRFRVSGDGNDADDGLGERSSISVSGTVEGGSVGGVADYVVGGSSTLTIRDTQVHDTGTYLCRAYNRIDSATASARLVVKGQIWRSISLITNK